MVMSYCNPSCTCRKCTIVKVRTLNHQMFGVKERLKQLSCCGCCRAGRSTPSRGEADNAKLWQLVWELLLQQRPVHAACGHQWTPLQVRSCVCVCVCVCAPFSHNVLVLMTRLCVLQLWQGFLWTQVCWSGICQSTNRRNTDHCYHLLCVPANYRPGWSSVLLLQMVRPYPVNEYVCLL